MTFYISGYIQYKNKVEFPVSLLFLLSFRVPRALPIIYYMKKLDSDIYNDNDLLDVFVKILTILNSVPTHLICQNNIRYLLVHFCICKLLTYNQDSQTTAVHFYNYVSLQLFANCIRYLHQKLSLTKRYLLLPVKIIIS